MVALAIPLLLVIAVFGLSISLDVKQIRYDLANLVELQKIANRIAHERNHQ